MKKKEESRSGTELSLTSINIVVIYSDLRKVVITHFASFTYTESCMHSLYIGDHVCGSDILTIFVKILIMFIVTAYIFC